MKLLHRTFLQDFLMYTIYNDINAVVYLMSACSTRIQRHISDSTKIMFILFQGKKWKTLKTKYSFERDT